MTKYLIVYKDNEGIVHKETQRFDGFFIAVDTVARWRQARPEQYAEILAVRARREDA